MRQHVLIEVLNFVFLGGWLRTPMSGALAVDRQVALPDALADQLVEDIAIGE
jgi:hypothetical protein